ncbi:MAG: hypothetical protein HUN04_24530 [Desulfobacter sp.]|nr:MAG: hypothetical protein HUN04_24530 [Desulfobacter sp.]
METDDKSKWINTILHELNLVGDEVAIKIVENCGRECIKSSNDYSKILKVRQSVSTFSDDDLIFEICHRELYQNKPTIQKQGSDIVIEYQQCSCGMVTSGKINHPFLCNCTVGYTKQIFETIYNRPVKVELQKSILNGDDICKQVITI